MIADKSSADITLSHCMREQGSCPLMELPLEW